MNFSSDENFAGRSSGSSHQPWFVSDSLLLKQNNTKLHRTDNKGQFPCPFDYDQILFFSECLITNLSWKISQKMTMITIAGVSQSCVYKLLSFFMN